MPTKDRYRYSMDSLRPGVNFRIYREEMGGEGMMSRLSQGKARGVIQHSQPPCHTHEKMSVAEAAIQKSRRRRIMQCYNFCISRLLDSTSRPTSVLITKHAPE